MNRSKYETPKGNDDLYSGYNEFNSAFSTKDIEQDAYIQEALKTSYGNRPGVYTSRRTPKTSMRHLTTGRLDGGTGFTLRTATASREANRPMTAVRGAGYTSSKSTTFDPLNQAASMASSSEKQMEKLENRIKKMEESVMESVDESCICNAKKDFSGALEKAKEASNREKALIRLHEEAGQPDQHNLDLTFLVLFNMAVQYTANEMYSEALNTYNIITRNRMFQNSNQLKVNMANIYAQLGQLPKAIKIYRMALDQVPNTHKDLRVNITHNIGILLVRMAQYHEACNSFEYIMQERPNFKAGLHRVLCYYAMGDKEKMKQSFKKMLEIQLDIDEDKYNATVVDEDYKMVLEVTKSDNLRKLEKEKRQKAEHAILTAAKLIANVIENNFTSGYNWCIEAIKSSKHESIAGDLEVNKAIMFLKQKNIPVAMETLKSLERRGSKLAAVAANNLAFIHFIEGDIDEAERLAEQAREADVYSPSPYVNLANCFFARQQFDKAKNLYIIALNNDPSCIEALYNLGVVHKELNEYEDSLRCFLRLQGLTANHPPVLYQLASIHKALGDLDQAIEWYVQLLTVVPVDPSVFLKLGQIYDNDNEKQQAFHYYYEAYRYLPSKLSVLEWLGAYYISHRVPEKAVSFYEKAALLQPNEAKWPLLIGSCYRRSGNYQQALQVYKTVNSNFPENIECLKLLVRLCNDLGLKETAEYAQELKQAEKAREIRQRISSSKSAGGSRKSSGRSSSPRTGTNDPGAAPLIDLSDSGSLRTAVPLERVPTAANYQIPQTPRPTTAFNDFDDFGEITEDLLPE